MSQMEPEVKRFLKKIVWTVSAGLVWMIMHVFLGLILGFAVMEDGVDWRNLLYYLWFVVSLLLLIRYLYQLWKDPVL